MPGYGEDMEFCRLGLEVGLGGGWKWRSELNVGSEGQREIQSWGLGKQDLIHFLPPAPSAGQVALPGTLHGRQMLARGSSRLAYTRNSSVCKQVGSVREREPWEAGSQ